MSVRINADGSYTFERGGPAPPGANAATQGYDVTVPASVYFAALSNWAAQQNAPTSIGQAPIILFNQQPVSLTSGGISVPNSTVAFKNPA